MKRRFMNPVKSENKEYLKYVGLMAVYFFALLVIFFRPLDVQSWQWADDALYYNNALSIISNIDGKYWLGPFDKVVISKAPLFSVFIAGSMCSGMPLRLAEFLLFAPLPFIFWKAVHPLQFKKWITIYLSALCFVCIPIAGFNSNLIRTTFFGALSLYFMISLTGLIIRIWTGRRRAWIWAFFTGLTLGLSATTREDASWLMLPIGIVTCLSLYFAWCSRKYSYYVIIFALISVGYLLPMTIFSTFNYMSYGIYAPSLRQDSTFRNFYAILCSLQPDQRQKYVPINTGTRQFAYAISPTFAKLKPYLEGPPLDPIARNKGHLSLNGWAEEGREFFVSNFEFALAEAIILSGRETGKAFIDFCSQATKEIRIAIERGEIEHGRTGFSMLPPIKLSDTCDISTASLKSFMLLAKGKGQYRKQLFQTDPPSIIATAWHSHLKTWPYPPLGSKGFSIKLQNRLFNSVVNLFRIIYSISLILGLAASIKTYRNKRDNYRLILTLLFVAWAGLLAFCFSMAIVDTIGFPILQWPEGYNIMGFFPLHFLLLISVLVFLDTVNAGISGSPSNVR